MTSRKYHNARIGYSWATFSFSLFFLLLISCSSEEPSKEYLALFIEENLFKDYPSKISKIDCQWIKTGENKYKSKVNVTIKLNEALYEKSSFDEFYEKNKQVVDEFDEQNRIFRSAYKKCNNLSSQYSFKRDQLASDILDFKIREFNFIKETKGKGSEFSYDIFVSSNKTAGELILKINDVSGKIEIPGQPRASFADNTFLIDSKEVNEFLDKAISNMKTFVAFIDSTEKEIAQKEAETAAIRLNTLLTLIKPKSFFIGSIVDSNKSIENIGLVVEQITASAVSGFLFNIHDPRKTSASSGTIIADSNPRLLIHLNDDEKATYDLEVEQNTNRLSGYVTKPTSREKAEVSFVPIDVKEVEIRIAEAVKREEQVKAELFAKEKQAKAEALAKEEQRKVEEQKIRAQAEDIEKQKKKVTVAHRMALLNVVKSGTFFVGAKLNIAKHVENIGLAVDRVTDDAVDGYIFDVDDPRKKKITNGVISSSPAPRLLLRVNGEITSFDLDVEEETQKLVGVTIASTGDSITKEGISEAITFSLIEKKWVEEKISQAVQRELNLKDEKERRKSEALAQEEKRKAEEQKKEAQNEELRRLYKERLAKAVTPGSAYLGNWKINNEVGEVGFAFEQLNDNDQSYEGYFFDPADRTKRKPFKGIMNWEYNTSKPLLLKAIKGKGLERSKNMSEFQKKWLEQEVEYSLPLDLVQPAEGWTGQTSGGWSVVVKPLADFSKLLEQDRLAIENRQQSILDAVKSGSAWSGTVQCAKYAAEIGIYFEKYQGGASTGYLFDPAALDIRKQFNGAVSMDADVVPIRLEANYESGIKSDKSSPFQVAWLDTGQSNTLSAIQKHWLASNRSPKIELELLDGTMRGKSQDCNINLTSLPNFASLLEEDATREKNRQKLLVDMVEPAKTYTGTWNTDDNSGEISMKILTRSPSGVVFTAEMFDPTEQAEVWPFNGSVLLEKPGHYTLTALKREKHKSRKRDQPGTTQYLFNQFHDHSNYSSSTLWVEDGNIRGRIFDKISIYMKSAVSTKQPVDTSKIIKGQDNIPVAGLKTDKVESTKVEKSGLKEKQVSNTTSVDKPTVSAVLSEVGKDYVEILLGLRASGKILAALRIDNIGGKRSLWRSDTGEKGETIVVKHNQKTLNPAGEVLQLSLDAEETVLSLILQNKGAFGDGETEFRVTAFFNDSTRTLCVIK